MPDSQDKNIRNAVIVMGGVGAGAIAFGGFSLFIMQMQKLMLEADGLSKASEGGMPIEALFHRLHELWAQWMPWLSALGVFWVVCAVLLGFGGIRWRGLSLIAVAAGMVWVVGYSLSSRSYVQLFCEQITAFSPEIGLTMSMSFGHAIVVFSACVMLLFPIMAGTLLIRLS